KLETNGKIMKSRCHGATECTIVSKDCRKVLQCGWPAESESSPPMRSRNSRVRAWGASCVPVAWPADTRTSPLDAEELAASGVWFCASRGNGADRVLGKKYISVSVRCRYVLQVQAPGH